MPSSRSVSPGKIRGTKRSPRQSRSASPRQMRGTRRSPIETKRDLSEAEKLLRSIERPEYINELERFLDTENRFPTPNKMAALIADLEEEQKKEEDEMEEYNRVTPYGYAHKGTTVWALKEKLKKEIARQKLESKTKKGGNYTRRIKKRRY